MLTCSPLRLQLRELRLEHLIVFHELKVFDIEDRRETRINLSETEKASGVFVEVADSGAPAAFVVQGRDFHAVD